MRSPDPAPSDRSFRHIAAKAGFAGSAFAVFACGWLATRSDDWKEMLLFSLLAVGGAVLASRFTRAAR